MFCDVLILNTYEFHIAKSLLLLYMKKRGTLDNFYTTYAV